MAGAAGPYVVGTSLGGLGVGQPPKAGLDGRRRLVRLSRICVGTARVCVVATSMRLDRSIEFEGVWRVSATSVVASVERLRASRRVGN